MTSSTGNLADITGEEAVNGLTGQTYPGNVNVNLTNNTSSFIDVTFTFTPELAGCADGPTVDVVVRVEPTPSLNPTLNTAVSVCEGNNIDIDIANTAVADGALTYAVDVTSSTGNLADITGEEAVNGLTGQAYPGNVNVNLNNNTTSTINVTFTFTPELAGCGDGTPVDVVVSVEPRPVIAPGQVKTICSRDNVDYHVNLIPAGLPINTDYSWGLPVMSDGSVQGSVGTNVPESNALTITDILTNTTSNSITATYSITPRVNGGNLCETLPPVDVVITIDPEPVGSDVNPAPLCSDATLAYNIQTQNINTNNGVLSQFTYTVASDNPDVAAGADRIVPSVDPISDGYVNDSGSPANITYTITPFNLIDGCQGDDFDVTFTFNSKPKGFDDIDEECSDVALNYDIQTQNIDDAINGNSVTSDFIYTVVSSSGSVPPAPNRTVKSALPITDTYTNNTGAPVDITYTIVPISQGTNCTGDPFTVTFTIQSEPLGSNATLDVCGGGAINFNLQGQITNGITSRFYYTVSSSSPGDVAPDPDRPIGSASTVGINTSYTNTSGAPVLITYTVTPIANDATNCEGNPFLVRFNIIPGPEGADDVEPATCSGVQLNYDIQADNIDALGNSIPGRFTYVVSSSNEGIIPTPAALDRTAASDLPITDTYTNTSTVPVTVTYTITPISDTGGCLGTPFNVDFEITPVPRGGDDLNNIVCSDGPVVYDIQVDNIDTFNGLASEFIYTVTSSDPANVPADADRVVYDAAPINTSYLNTTSSPVFITYSITPRETVSGDLCEGEEFDVRFQINPEPVIDPALDNSVCSDENINVTLATNGISVNAANYNLMNVTIPVGLTPRAGNVVFPQNGVSATYIRFDRYENLTNGPLTVDYELIPISASGCQGDLLTIQVEILPEPVLDPALSPTPVCSGLPSGVILSEDAGSVAAASYNINGISVPAGLTASAGNANIGDGQPSNAIQNDTFINTTSVPLQVTYTITPVSAAGCEGDDQTVTFTINPSPDLANLDETVCSGENSSIVLGTSGSSAFAANYRIVSVTPDPLLTVVFQTADNTTTNDTNEIFNDQYINTTDNPLTVEYRVIPISGAVPPCEGPEESIILTVEPEPSMSVPADENICSNDITSISLNSTTVPTSGVVTFDVQAIPIGAVTGAPFLRQNLNNGFIIQDQLLNLGNTVGEVQYTITPKTASAKNGLGCAAGTPTVVSVFVEPSPRGTFNQLFVSICEDESIGDLDNFITTPTVPSNGNVEFVLTEVVASDPNISGMSLDDGSVVIPANGEITDVLTIADGVGVTSPQTVTYRLTPRIVGSDAVVDCNGAANSVEMIVTVRPRGVVTPAFTNIELCSGESFQNNLTLDLDAGTAIASWTVVDNPNVEGEFDALGNTMFLSLINNSTSPQTLEYIVTPQSLFDANCIGNPVSVFVTVNPVPDVVIADAEIVRCDGDQADIPLDGNVAGTRFEWSANVLSGSVTFGGGVTSGTGTNGNMIDHLLTNTGTTPAIIRYTIESYYDKTLPTGNDPCEGFVPGFVTLTLSPPVSAAIVPHPDDGTGTRFRCVGNVEAVQFQFTGSAPFELTYIETDASGASTTIVEPFLPAQFSLITSETVSYELVQVEDANGCVAISNESVDIIFEEAVADLEVRGDDANNAFGFTKTPPDVLMDFNSGTAQVVFRFNNYDPANTYELQIGDLVFEDVGPTFTHIFTEPSPLGSVGYSAELKAFSPTIGDVCNDVDNFFIRVIPASPEVIACIGEGCETVSGINTPEDLPANLRQIQGCAPLTVDIYSYVFNGTTPLLSRNIEENSIVWTIDGQRITTPNTTYTFTQPGTYNIELEAQNGYDEFDFDAVVATVNVVPTAQFTITQEVVFIPDDGFRPTNRSQNADTFVWDFGDFNTSIERSPEHFYEEEGIYDVSLIASLDHGTDVNGTSIVCYDTLIQQVTVEEGGFTKTPNAFTPNLNGPSGGAEFDPNVPGSGDLANDIFLPITVGVQEFKMWIYDRWGNLIFFSDNQRVGWDGYDSKGNLLPAGVYVYKLDLILSNGQRTTRVGDVTLIR
ncbi:MAG: PKD-like domain-containing protein [Fulvivirga sp.]|uniref:PKD-like domain-containing protein n=1 Tax=Fulvivirga sp. TaxID=1931237 RepID=UPI0032EFDCE1